MALSISTGTANGPDGRETCLRAIDAAREGLDPAAGDPVLAIVAASPEFFLPDIQRAVNIRLGEVALWGFSGDALHNRAAPAPEITVALAAGPVTQAAADWFDAPGMGASGLLKRLLPSTTPAHKTELLLLMTTDASRQTPISSGELPSALQVAGGYAAADRRRSGGRPGTDSIYTGPAGSGPGLAAASLRGDFSVGIGAAHGWLPIGPLFRVTAADADRLLEIEGKPAVQFYREAFLLDREQLLQPPYNELIKIYPFSVTGLEGDRFICSPVRIEKDGTVLLGLPIEPGCTAQLLVGSAGECIEAAERAAAEALVRLAGVRPQLALVFVDAALQILKDSQPFDLTAAIGAVIGPQVPQLNCFTTAQICSPGGEGVEWLNGHIEVVLIG
jgi:hypothetical protein